MPIPPPVVTTTSTSSTPSFDSNIAISTSSSSPSSVSPSLDKLDNSRLGGLKDSEVNPTTPTFDEHNEIPHRIEFEAPPSAGPSQPLSEGRFSIDFSLELERQLANMESPPVTPAFDITTHAHAESARMDRSFTTSPERGQSGHAVKRSGGSEMEGVEARPGARSASGSGDIRDLLPDPEVLAHIITQLRHSLADMTKDRDELLKMLGNATSEEANAKDALQLMTDKVTQAEEDLMEARKKIREDEEQIVLLRSKVEEARRGVMRLQTESRRQSMAPIDVNRASGMFSNFTSPPTNKRASFAPLTGSKHGHRRISSVSDSSVLNSFPTPDLTPSPNGSTTFSLTPATPATELPPSANPRRFSGMYGRYSPPDSSLLHQMSAAENSAELELVRSDMKTLKAELDNVRHELAEANEAKEASETCVRALREYIAENNVGAVKLPPPPTMANGEDSPAEPKKTASGWGFKLWGGASAATDSGMKSAGPLPPSSAPSTPSIPQGVSVSAIAGVTEYTQTTPVGPAPLSRKLTGLWSSRSSFSSTREKEKEQPVLPPLQTAVIPPRMEQRDSVYSYSDASTLAEPVSPGSDINGLGIPGPGGFMKGHAQPGMISEEKEDGVVTSLSTPLDEVDIHALT